MVCSPARLASNRANSLKSRGPVDTSRTRFNSLKHGLTAAVALPDEDQAAIRASLDNLVRDYDPQTEEELILIEDAAYLSVRLKRTRRHDAAMLSKRVRHAVEDFHKAREDGMNDAIARIDVEPARAVDLLKRDPDGLDWLVQQWEMLRQQLVESQGGTLEKHGLADGFGVEQVATMVRLMGREYSFVQKPREALLHEAFGGYFGNLDPADRKAVPDEAKIEWARGLLLAMIDRELAEVKGLRDSFDIANLKADQDEARDRALFDPSKEAILARRYEAATRRELKKTFRDLKELAAMRAEEDAPDVPEMPEMPEESDVASKGRGSLASFCKIKGAAIVADEGRAISMPEGPPGAEMVVLTGRPEVETDVIPPRIE